MWFKIGNNYFSTAFKTGLIIKVKNFHTKKTFSFFILAILFSTIALFSIAFTIKNNAIMTSYVYATNMMDINESKMLNTTNSDSNHYKIQNLTKTNIPITFPLIKGYVKGNEVFYITTEVSDKTIAKHLSNITNSRVTYTPSLKLASQNSLANIYEFKNGIKGSGPEGFQPNVADSQPGDSSYSPLWRINLVEWKTNVTPKELKSESDIINAQKVGQITITQTDIVVNCPFVKWSDGELKIRQDKTLNNTTPNGGGQILSFDAKNNKVTFVGHRGFAPDGSTIYYIATDASKMDVARNLGVTFVNKTGYPLASGASSDLYVFTNGVKGTGPMGFQVSIGSSNAGDMIYSPMWKIQLVTWNHISDAQMITKLNQLNSVASKGMIYISISGVVVNCPFVEAKNT